MERSLRVVLLGICAVALLGLGRQLQRGRAPSSPRLPAVGSPLEDDLWPAGPGADSVLVLVIDPRCTARRARLADLRKMVGAADSAGYTTVVVAMGDAPLDTVLYDAIHASARERVPFLVET